MASNIFSELKTKFVVVTGGVVSGIGKGVATASIGALLKSRLKIVPIKCDGYLNTDPGTMNPVEHGEVFVLDDGGEVDMDFGHYERFLSIFARSEWSITMGKIYQRILENERRGVYLGKTVQLIPHVSDEIKRRIYTIAKEEKADLILLEIGGTIGDMENELFVETARQISREQGRGNVMFVHLTYIPVPSGVQKSKPTQQSVKILNQAGIYPDLIIGRCDTMISDSVREKISLYCNVPVECVISGVDVDPLYELPLLFEKQKVPEIIHKRLGIYSPPDLSWMNRLVGVLKKNKNHPRRIKTVALCGKYTDMEDSYASICEALNHASAHLDVCVQKTMIEVTGIENREVEEKLKGIDGVIIPGGFGARAFEEKIAVVRYLREKKIPFLGICLGMQLAVVEFARHVCGMENAHTIEVGEEHAHPPVVTILSGQKNLKQLGGTMRLGGQDVEIKPGSQVYGLYKTSRIRERFRHRYEINPEYLQIFEDKGMCFSGKSPEGDIVQMMELPHHPFFMGSQFHPELTSRLEKPAPLFLHFVTTLLS